MKRKIFGGIAVLALATVIGINVKMSQQENKLADLILANVEALATIECVSQGGGVLYYCIDYSLITRCTCASTHDGMAKSYCSDQMCQ